MGHTRQYRMQHPNLQHPNPSCAPNPHPAHMQHPHLQPCANSYSPCTTLPPHDHHHHHHHHRGPYAPYPHLQHSLRPHSMLPMYNTPSTTTTTIPNRQHTQTPTAPLRSSPPHSLSKWAREMPHSVTSLWSRGSASRAVWWTQQAMGCPVCRFASMARNGPQQTSTAGGGTVG